MKNYKSRESSIENVKKLFANTDSDIITLEEAFAAWGDRNDMSFEDNKSWISNLLTHLKYNKLVKPIYSRKNKKRILTKIQLTLVGKKALGRLDENLGETIETDPKTPEQIYNSMSNSTVSMSDAMKLIARLRKENPDYQITFDIKLKEMME